MTSNAYVATHLLKDLTATEYSGQLKLGTNCGKLFHSVVHNLKYYI